MMLKIPLDITGIHFIFEYIKIENIYIVAYIFGTYIFVCHDVEY